nr:MAG TPA: hypothetical protein [Caudoviricetes sp.]DAQ57627.1 MAG TPA: hypothetical protein [Caudoviricetes sp.]
MDKTQAVFYFALFSPTRPNKAFFIVHKEKYRFTASRP